MGCFDEGRMDSFREDVSFPHNVDAKVCTTAVDNGLRMVPIIDGGVIDSFEKLSSYRNCKSLLLGSNTSAQSRVCDCRLPIPKNGSGLD